jgi:flagellar protein FliO/FliZ
MTIQFIRILLAFSGCFLSLLVCAQEEIVDEIQLGTVSAELTNKKLLPTQVLDSVEVNQSLQLDKKTETSLVKTENPNLFNQVEPSVEKVPTNNTVNEDTPQVGKHVMANMNASSMILSLLMVLVLIFICALILKRFNLVQQGVSELKMVASLPLGSKERVVVVQVGEQQFMLGVTSQQINLIETLPEPLLTKPKGSGDLPKSVLSLLSPKVVTANKK